MLFVFTSFSYSQAQERLVLSVQELNSAMVSRNYERIDQLLHQKCYYGHSNGWVEHKHDIIENLKSSKLTYRKITLDSIEIQKISSKTRSVVYLANVSGELSQKPFEIHLKVVQLWMKQRGRWKLVLRQAVKLPQ